MPLHRTLPALLESRASLGDKPLFRCGETVWTYKDTPHIAAHSAGRLRAAGIVPGDRVAIMGTNSAEFLEVYLGCAWSGVIAVPVNAALRGPALRHVLSQSGARLLAVDPGLRGAVEALDLAIEMIWSLADLPPPGAALPAAQARPGDTVAILYTSGTTGPAKGVCCPQAQMVWWGINTGRMLGVTADDVLGTTMPLFHTNALNTFYQALVAGASMVLEPRFSASGFWPAMAASGATVTYVLGAMVPILLAQPPTPAERAHRLRVALAPGVPAHLLAALTERTGIAIVDGYGSTETNFVIGTTAADTRPGRMGPVAAGFEAQIVDEDDNPLPPGTPGELVLRAAEPFAFATGYWNLSEKTVEAWRNLRFHTGDRVVQDEHGWFAFVDRLKDAIRRRGENISSWEVEQVLLSHPAVATAAAYPVPSPLAEDEVMAALILRSPATPAEIIAHCTPLLARFALPRYIDIVDSLPMTGSGKVQKYLLTERGVTPTAWDREAAG